MTVQWIDVTSRTKGDKSKEIKTTQASINGFEIVVTRYAGYDDELVMHCKELGISCKPLGTSDMGDAQQVALSLVKKSLSENLTRLQSVLDSLQVTGLKIGRPTDREHQLLIENQRLREELMAAARIFMHYGDLHADKGEAGVEKAKKNYDLHRRFSEAAILDTTLPSN